MEKKTKWSLSFIFTLLPLFLFAVLSFNPAYGGPETLGPSPAGQIKSGDTLSRTNEITNETAEDDAEPVVVTSDEKAMPVKVGQISSSDKKAAPLRLESGFDAFNGNYQNQWRASFSEKTGKVNVLYGTLSKQYADGPENVSKGFLKDSYMIFGLKQDLSDLKTLRVDKTPERNHVRFQQTYNNVPIVGVFVLVHSNPQGQVTMVQNSYIQGFQVANGQVVAAEAAKSIARVDLEASLKGATLSDAKAEQLIAPYKGGYYYVWKIAIPTRDPFGYWVYHLDAETGEILYKGNEILSLKNGQGRAFTTDANWYLGKISNVSLKNMFSASETPDWGYLWGLHADILDYSGNNPWSGTYKFLYDYYTQKAWFDATDAYYQMATTWDWWNKNVILKYGPSSPDYFYSNPPAPTYVNVNSMCNAFYSPDITGGGFPGFAFGDENSCVAGSEDLVIDYDVVHHEFTHAMMDWSGFDSQFGGPVNYYGRAMGEGNADWFAYLWHPKDPGIGGVAWYWSGDYLRYLDGTQMYPYDVGCSGGLPEEHCTGEIWGGYLYDLYRVLGSSAALKYIYNSFYYFDPSGGWMDSSNPYVSTEPDFWDGIWAQMNAEYDLTGKYTSSFKAWGSMTSRGINGLLRPFYSHPSNYFYTNAAGSDSTSYFMYNFPPVKTINTKGNLLITHDLHDYIVNITQTGWDLTATVTANNTNGIINPYIYLYDGGGNLWTSVGPSTSKKATLKYYNVPTGLYVIRVTGTNAAAARGYYNFTVNLK